MTIIWQNKMYPLGTVVRNRCLSPDTNTLLKGTMNISNANQIALGMVQLQFVVSVLLLNQV